MSRQQNDDLSIVTGAIVNAFRRVTMSGATCLQAGATDVGIGVAQAYTASGAAACIRPYSRGSCKMMTSGAITAGDDVFPAADGKVSATAVAAGPVGLALEAATAAGDIIEVMPRTLGTYST